ncbi:hypothetical protein FRZ40_11240 [Paraburkholderia azotifigens]|uniref:Uncharacterized protein n=1 Tax=Paraburkholderia azotifigens TaxID=2057004 RepID=A0A5C6VU29_9BURK|nr:hypothetical protein FRZ40_11240 [Paraburkholderia azotifigens]
MDNRGNCARNSCGIDVDVNGVTRQTCAQARKLSDEHKPARTSNASGYAFGKTLIHFGKPWLSTETQRLC